MAEVNFIIEVEWLELDGDCRQCTFCEDSIYGKMYLPFFQNGKQSAVTFLDIDLCQSCKDIAKIEITPK